MRDALSAFEDIVISVTIPIILLFTKKDVFEENLRVQPFSDFFPEYTGMMDSLSICEYIASMFRSLHKRPNGQLYIRFVNATDPHQFKQVFKEIESYMLERRPVLPKNFVPSCSPWNEPHLPHEASSSTIMPSKAASDNNSEVPYLHIGPWPLIDDPTPGLAI